MNYASIRRNFLRDVRKEIEEKKTEVLAKKAKLEDINTGEVKYNDE